MWKADKQYSIWETNIFYEKEHYLVTQVISSNIIAADSVQLSKIYTMFTDKKTKKKALETCLRKGSTLPSHNEIHDPNLRTAIDIVINKYGCASALKYWLKEVEGAVA